MTIDIIDRLHDNGDLSSLVLSGIISPGIIKARKIYHSYNSRIEAGASKMQAISETSETFSTSERSVFRVLEKMKYDEKA